MAYQNVVKERGAWKLKETLGAGGFGMITLWEHMETKEKIAIKQRNVTLDAKICKRWGMEIDIIRRLDHTYVVKAMDVPEDLKAPDGELPVLGMEYCVGGDLRKVLLKAENVCGLKQNVILDIAKHTSSAVEYLHSKRIIHRDLKPENIVLQHEDGRTLYKLIDAGYAKDLDQDSEPTSFVGTLQYLAPELFTLYAYTLTVDFWSLGTVISECITGRRPFLPNFPPVKWHGTISQKKDTHISAYESSNGEVIFSEHLFAPNDLSRPYQNLFEYWLKHMLLWDHNKRGGGQDDKKRAKCFGILDRIIDCKTLNVLSMVDDTLHSYIATDTDSLTILQTQLAKDTGVPIEDQEILLPTGMAADSSKPALQCGGGREQQDLVVFLFNRSKSAKNFPDNELPDMVQSIIQDPKTVMPYPDRKKIWGQACCYCGKQVADCSRLLEGARAAMLCLLRLNTALHKENSKLTEQHHKLHALQDHFSHSLELDVDMYAIQAANGIMRATRKFGSKLNLLLLYYALASEKMFRNWKTAEKEVVEFAVTDRVHKLDYRVNAIQTRVVELQRSPFARMEQADILVDTDKMALDLYAELRQTGREEAQDSTKIVHLVLKSITERAKITKELCSHLVKLMACKQDIEKLMPEINTCLDEMKHFENKLVMFQKQRQKDIHLFEEAFDGMSMRSDIQQNVQDSPDLDDIQQNVQDSSDLDDIQQIVQDSSDLDDIQQIVQDSSDLDDIQQNVQDSSDLDDIQQIVQDSSDLDDIQQIVQDTSDLDDIQQIVQDSSDLDGIQQIVQDSSDLDDIQQIVQDSSDLDDIQQIVQDSSDLDDIQQIVQDSSDLDDIQQIVQDSSDLDDIQQIVQDSSDLDIPNQAAAAAVPAAASTDMEDVKIENT